MLICARFNPPNNAASNGPNNERKSEGCEIMRADLNSMSLEDLWSLHEQLDSVLTSRLAAEKAELEKKLDQLRAPRTTARRPYPPVLPKFRNPRRPSETWAGRGKQARWLSAQLQNGKKMEDFRIRAS